MKVDGWDFNSGSDKWMASDPQYGYWFVVEPDLAGAWAWYVCVEQQWNPWDGPRVLEGKSDTPAGARADAVSAYNQYIEHLLRDPAGSEKLGRATEEWIKAEEEGRSP